MGGGGIKGDDVTAGGDETDWVGMLLEEADAGKPKTVKQATVRPPFPSPLISLPPWRRSFLRARLSKGKRGAHAVTDLVSVDRKQPKV